MKILILYSARSGTNSIAEYFLSQNPYYKYYNQPWSPYSEEGMIKDSYDNCIKAENVIIKSEIYCFETYVKIPIERLNLDFDKILLITRKNKREQAISNILAQKNNNFLDKTPRKYHIESIGEEEIEVMIKNLEECDLHLNKYVSSSVPIFYYEDLFYGSFENIFQFLNIKYSESNFKMFLSRDKRYFTGEIKGKKEFSFI